MITTIIEIVGMILAVIVGIDALTGFKLIKSLFNRGRKGVEDLAEAARDPLADAQIAISDIEKDKASTLELRKQVLMEVSLAKSRKTKAQSNVNKYEDLARLAGQAKNLDDVKLALEKKVVAEQEFKMAENDIARFSKQEDELEDKIRECGNLLEKAKSNKQYLANSLKFNKFKTKITNVLVNDNGAAQSALARLENDVQRSAAEAEASSELAQDGRNLEDKYASDKGVSDDEAAKYMQA